MRIKIINQSGMINIDGETIPGDRSTSFHYSRILGMYQSGDGFGLQCQHKEGTPEYKKLLALCDSLSSTIIESDESHAEPKKREWVYVMKPKAYGIAGCACGNEDTQWSEYVKHLWCEKCQKDFIPEHNGVFDGPIPVGAATMLGLSFDRIDLKTKQRIKFDVEDLKYAEA